MPRVAGVSTPKYRKHRSTGQAVVTICGRDHYLGPHGTKGSRVEYDRLIGEWLAAGRPTTITRGRDLPIAELCHAYWRHAQSYYTQGGMRANIVTAIRALRSKYGKTLAVEFGPLALKTVRQGFVDDGKARSYCNRLTDLIRRIFKWATGEEMIPLHTWQALTSVGGLRRGHTVARETMPVRPVEDSIVDATLPHLPAVIADMVRLQRATGCRPAEVCILRPCDVDRSGKVWAYRPQSHKTQHHGRERVVFIGPKGQEVLRPYLLRAPETFCFSPADSERIVTDREEFELRAQTIEALSICRSIPLAIFDADPGISTAPFEKAVGIEPPSIARRRTALKAARPKILRIMRHLDAVPPQIWLRRHDLITVRDALRQLYTAIEPFLDPSPSADVVSGAFTTLLETLDEAEKAVWDAIGREDWIYQPELSWLSEYNNNPAATNVDATFPPGGVPEQPVVFTPLQMNILTALYRRALTKAKLAEEVCGGDGRRLYRSGGIKELKAQGRVKNRRTIGYFRPDAPPLELSLDIAATHPEVPPSSP